MPVELPPKKDVALALLEQSTVFVHLDPRAQDVVVPAWFKKQPQLVLQIGLNMPVPIPDLQLDDDCVSCTLSFNRSPFFCRIPWKAVYALIGEDRRGMVWPNDVPREVAVQAQAQARAELERAEREKQRARFKVVDGGEPSATGARPSAPSADERAAAGPAPRPAAQASAPEPVSASPAETSLTASEGGEARTAARPDSPQAADARPEVAPPQAATPPEPRRAPAKKKVSAARKKPDKRGAQPRRKAATTSTAKALKNPAQPKKAAKKASKPKPKPARDRAVASSTSSQERSTPKRRTRKSTDGADGSGAKAAHPAKDATTRGADRPSVDGSSRTSRRGGSAGRQDLGAAKSAGSPSPKARPAAGGDKGGSGAGARTKRKLPPYLRVVK